MRIAFQISDGNVPQTAVVFVKEIVGEEAIVKVPKFSQNSRLEFKHMTVQLRRVPVSYLDITPTTLCFSERKQSVTVTFGYDTSLE